MHFIHGFDRTKSQYFYNIKDKAELHHQPSTHARSAAKTRNRVWTSPSKLQREFLFDAVKKTFTCRKLSIEIGSPSWDYLKTSTHNWGLNLSPHPSWLLCAGTIWKHQHKIGVWTYISIHHDSFLLVLSENINAQLWFETISASTMRTFFYIQGGVQMRGY